MANAQLARISRASTFVIPPPGKADTYIGGAFILVAVVIAVRESRARQVPVANTVAEFFRQTKENYQRANVKEGELLGEFKLPALWMLPALAMAVVLIAIGGPTQSYENTELLGILNLVFISLISWVLATAMAQSFIRNHQTHLLFVGTAHLLVGTSAAVGSIFLQPTSPNASVTVFNVCMLVAGVLLASSVTFAWRSREVKVVRATNVVLVSISYALALVLIVVLAWASVSGRTPAFVLPQGFSIIRQVVIGVGTLLFSIAAVAYGVIYRRSRSALTFWYSLGIGAFSIGLLAVLLQPSVGSILG